MTLTALAVLASPIGCLDEEAPQKCPELRPTGGDYLGRWEAIGACFQRDPTLSGACPSLRGVVEGVSMGGWIEFRADGTYSQDTFIDYGERLDFPLSCFANLATTCHDLAPIFAKQSSTATSTTTVFCRGTAQCRCAAHTEEITKVAAGQIRREGTRLIEGMNAVSYSVVGDEIHLQAPELLYRFSRL